MKVVFRTDASLQIGTGHVMRCLTLAGALRAHGAECRFVCRAGVGNLLELIGKAGFDAIALPVRSIEAPARRDEEPGPVHAGWLGTDWKTDAEEVIGIINDGGAQPDWLVVDHYALDANWESRLRPYCRRLLAIDDLADRNHDCDLLLDQNLVARMFDRYTDRVPARCGLLLGPKFALLQPPYAELHSNVSLRAGKIRRILVFFGGSDPANLAGKAIDAFLSLGQPDIEMDIVINPDGPHAAAVRGQVEGKRQIHLHERLPSLAPLMARADLAIGAGGSTSWERCCLGLPSLVVTIAENQRPIAAELDRQGLVRWLGDLEEVDTAILASRMREIVDRGLAPEWSERCHRLVDGKGTVRVADMMGMGGETRLVVRPAEASDEALLLRWANDPQVRANSFTLAKIDPVTHHAWLEKRLGNPDGCRLYIVETATQMPVGQVRFERSGDTWEIHYAIDAYFRGRGLGKPFLNAALVAFKADLNRQGEVFGRVKPDNSASRRIFAELGFAERKCGSDLSYHYQIG